MHIVCLTSENNARGINRGTINHVCKNLIVMKKYINNSNQQAQGEKINVPYQWTGTATDLMEVVKGLIEGGYIVGNQTDLFNDFCNLLQVAPANTKDLIKGIRRRKGNKFYTVINMRNGLISWHSRLEKQKELKERIKELEKNICTSNNNK